MSSTSFGEKSNQVIPAITGQIDLSKAYHIFPDFLQSSRPTILAYNASLISTTIGFPLDTMKTRMQTAKFRSTFDCFSKTLAHEGLKGLFRGILAPLISTSISKSMSVSLYTTFKPITSTLPIPTIERFTKNDTISPTQSHLITIFNNAPVAFLSGFFAGGIIPIFACPFEFTKVYSQISKIVQYKSQLDSVLPNTTLKTMRQIVAHDGLFGLYSGFKYHLLRDSVASGFYFAFYESTKIGLNYLAESSNLSLGPVTIAVAGGTAGICSWVIVFPVDTTKSLIQRDYVTNILRRDSGLEPLPLKKRKLAKFSRKMYRGLGVSVSRSIVTNMVFFSCYEFFMSTFA